MPLRGLHRLRPRVGAHGRFRSFGRRIEGQEFHKLRAIGDRLASRRSADGDIDRVLSAIRTGQPRQREHVIIVISRHRMDGGHRKLVARQRSCLVRTENIDAARFVDRREAGWQNSQTR